MTFLERMQESVILFDGALGTQIQEAPVREEDWQGKPGCLEILNLTVPHLIQEIHERYLAAGADAIETNSFGANAIGLAEYGLQDRVVDINLQAARIARRAADKFAHAKPRFVAGSIGPGTKLISLGQTDTDSLAHSTALQVEGLVRGGVDLLLIETCQDLLHIKTCLRAARDTCARLDRPLPLLVSVTVETNGTLLIGSDISAVIASLRPLDLDGLGLNCATGPESMHPYIRQLCQSFPGPVLCLPNAGLPQNVGGQLVYALSPEEFVRSLKGFVIEEGVSLVGGCCGTTPAHIAALAQALQGLRPRPRQVQAEPQIASMFGARALRQLPAPFYVGERTNTNGSREFREALLAGDWEHILQIARSQEEAGAHGLDVSVAYVGRDEQSDMQAIVTRLSTQIGLPLFLDSTSESALEAGLRSYGGRAVINSVNLEAGEDRARRICALAKRYGAALVALTIDENGMALGAEHKLEVARRLYRLAVDEAGLDPCDLIFDPLTFTLGSGDESLKTAGLETLEGIRRIKSALPGVFTILGVSNISFGLQRASREILNSVFLAEAIKAGLDLAIVHTQKIVPLYRIDPQDAQLCLELIHNRGERPLFAFLEHFKSKQHEPIEEAEPSSASPREIVQRKVLQGSQLHLETVLLEALKETRAVDIINQWLIPAMKQVGGLFGEGKLQLPFVLQSAEVMKAAVDLLKPFLETKEIQDQKSIVLATVRGDVHDIGKNLVDIILSNNGYRVYNLGIKCEIETIIAKVQEVRADAIGMSGLLVKSALIMKDNIEELSRRGLSLPVLLGGAALTRPFVEEHCTPLLDAPVVYCKDAFEGLKTMELLRTGGIEALPHCKAPRSATGSGEPSAPASGPDWPIARNVSIPTPPFWGQRLVRDIDLEEVFGFLTQEVLFRGRWGYRRGKLNAQEYEELIRTQAQPALQAWKARCRDEHLLSPQVVYGYFPCQSEGNDVWVYPAPHGSATQTEPVVFSFPRQAKAPRLCIADYFLPRSSGKMDVIAFQVVTVGSRASHEAQRLFAADQYKDYLLFHGLSIEATEALAELWHKKVRTELGILAEDGQGMADFVAQKYRGSRYSFGYPACPELADNRKIFRLLDPAGIGVSLTEEDEMVPEQTTSAFIVHHPQAKYFVV